MKLGVITNGISDDLAQALQVMEQDGLQYADLQFVWGKEIGDHTDEEITAMAELLHRHHCQTACITRHNFAHMSVFDTTTDSEQYQRAFCDFKRSIQVAKRLGTRLVRIMSFSKVPVLWGADGADRWLARDNQAWGKLLALLEGPVAYAQEQGIELVMETGVFSIGNNAYTVRRIIDELGYPNLKILWDPANAFYTTEEPFPYGYEQIRHVLGHVHIKDFIAERHKAQVGFCPLGQGEMGPYLPQIARALREDNYQGVVTLEAAYKKAAMTDEEGYRAQIGRFLELFA